MTTAKTDQRYMDACLRLARRHRGLTASNPSVGTLLVQFENDSAVIVGKGITAKGGRPHAERIAIDQARDRAKGSTAYVSLEPCAHHGATPPCAQALIDAGVARVVTAWIDPDTRVDGQGHRMLKDAGIQVETGQGASTAEHDLGNYLNRKLKNRPYVTLKLAVSHDGKLGLPNQEIAITGALVKNIVHRMRAENDAILVGRGTVEADDPELTCRLNGLENRSPQRFILDSSAQLPAGSHLAKTARDVPTHVVSTKSELPENLATQGVKLFVAESHGGKLALPEILEDMAASGISSLMVEGGAAVATSFLEAGLVDEVAYLTGAASVGEGGIPSPVVQTELTKSFNLARQLVLGDDKLDIYLKA